MTSTYDVLVIGAGPAGLAAAIKADSLGARVLLVEREARPGGILKQCIHDGFGLLRFGEKLSGPEYAARFIELLPESGVTLRLFTFVTRICRAGKGFAVTLVSNTGMETVLTKRLIFATGCRERTSRQIGIHGRHCAGVLTAGTAQHYTNLMGYLPTRRCVILGSGDIGLIMARRLTLEGAQVLGVYEAKPTPSGLSRNIAQCLDDFQIPLYTGKTVTRLMGEERLTGVEISDVDERMRSIPGTQQCISCDGLILSVGLIPENELAETLCVPMDPRTKGPLVDQRYETMVPGVYACGNGLTVFDLVDYVTESGEGAGSAAATMEESTGSQKTAAVKAGNEFLWVVPQRLTLPLSTDEPLPFFFRAAQERGKTRLRVTAGQTLLLEKTYAQLRPPEMERLMLPLSKADLRDGDTITFTLTEA